MPTVAPAITAFCREFQTEIGITARSALDTKKKELVGDFKNGGQQWRPRGRPVEVRTKDFKDKELGKAIPYGIYDLADRQRLGQRRDRS